MSCFPLPKTKDNNCFLSTSVAFCRFCDLVPKGFMSSAPRTALDFIRGEGAGAGVDGVAGAGAGGIHWQL